MNYEPTPAMLRALAPYLNKAAKIISDYQKAFDDAPAEKKEEIIFTVLKEYPFACELSFIRCEIDKWRRQGRTDLIKSIGPTRGKRSKENVFQMQAKRREIRYRVDKLVQGGMTKTDAFQAAGKKMYLSEEHIRKSYYKGKYERPFYFFEETREGVVMKWGPTVLICKNGIFYDAFISQILGSQKIVIHGTLHTEKEYPPSEHRLYL